jgi:hypothetical protein
MNTVEPFTSDIRVSFRSSKLSGKWKGAKARRVSDGGETTLSPLGHPIPPASRPQDLLR